MINRHFQAQASEAFLVNLVLKVHQVHRVPAARHWPTLGRRFVLKFMTICSVRLCCGTSDQSSSSLLSS